MVNRLNEAIQEFENKCRQEAQDGSARCNFFPQQFLRENFESDAGEFEQLSDAMYEAIRRMGFSEYGRQSKNILFVTWPVNPKKLYPGGTHFQFIVHLVHETTRSSIFARAFAAVETSAARDGEPLTPDYLNFCDGFSMQHYLRTTYPDMKLNAEGVRLACALRIKEMYPEDERQFPREMSRHGGVQMSMNTVGVNKFGNTMRIYQNHTVGNQVFDHVAEEDNTYATRMDRRKKGVSHFESNQVAPEKYGERYNAYPEHPYKSMSAFESRAGQPTYQSNAYQTRDYRDEHIHQPDRGYDAHHSPIYRDQENSPRQNGTREVKQNNSQRPGGLFNFRGLFPPESHNTPNSYRGSEHNSGVRQSGMQPGFRSGPFQSHSNGMQPYQTYGNHGAQNRLSQQSRKSDDCKPSCMF